ncbi:MAG: Beta-N-acetylhexosaminidase [Hyphomicrobiales bacterium]|nr:Beta-N-acetylhexosaminidase [Hyphomicrobiales bacterium]
MSREVRAFICGCSGFVLTPEERDFMRRMNPWGLILFGRNVQNRAQLKAITEDFRYLVGRPDAPVLIDQEGGRVQRMRRPEWRAYPAAASFVAAARDEGPLRLSRLSARLMAADLAEVGVNVDCMPVLDVPTESGHAVIGDRAYGGDPALVARMGRAVCEGLLEGGVLPVLKHIPGHGRAGADSHFDLPVVTASFAELEASDFAPFRALRDMPLAMSAHVIYSAIDPDRPATVSPIVVRDVIRGAIGFDGLVMSDDLSMKALSGSFTEKTQALFAAGLDMALYCWSDLADAHAVALAAPMLDGERAERAGRALEMLRPPAPFDAAEAAHQLGAALSVEA